MPPDKAAESPPDNPIQFAVVREDPATELAVLDRFATAFPSNARVLLVASGGCTALTMSALRPALELTLLDANAAQLDLVQRKAAALRAHGPGSHARKRIFGVDVDDPASLSGCGNFESLFRGLRALLDDLVLHPLAARLGVVGAGVLQDDAEAAARGQQDLAAVGRAVVEIQRVRRPVTTERVDEHLQHVLLALLEMGLEGDDVAGAVVEQRVDAHRPWHPVDEDRRQVADVAVPQGTRSLR